MISPCPNYQTQNSKNLEHHSVLRRRRQQSGAKSSRRAASGTNQYGEVLLVFVLNDLHCRTSESPAAGSRFCQAVLIADFSYGCVVRSTHSLEDRVVITGIGIVTATGRGREAAWQAVQAGVSGVQRLHGLTGIPDGLLLGATVDIDGDFPGQLKNMPLCHATAAEALDDSGLWLSGVDRERFGCSIGAHMGDTDYVVERLGLRELIPPGKHPWCEQWLPNTACAMVAQHYDLRGPRLSNSTACASGTIAILKAARAIQDGQCDLALAGSSEAIHPLFAAGFYNMRVLADHEDPTQACRPFDVNRSGFVMGEGAAMFVLERLDHAQERRAKIYAEILGGRMLSDAHHVTSLGADSRSLVELITGTLRSGQIAPGDIAYVNAHGTGTQQNDVMEARGIRLALGRAADAVCVSSNKSMLGHLVNASGSVELALTALALRDGFAPPTLNLTHPDPECDLDCIPLVGRERPLEHALKLSIAFGGHLAAIALRRWSGREAREAEPLARRRAA
jgi:3-oxoacyl-(acyl-carrier-protein) synthase